MKHWWGVTGSRRAISGTTPSLDITLRGWDLAPFTFGLGRITDDHLKHLAGMDVTRIYAIVAGSLFAVLTTINFCIHLCTILQTFTVWILRHIVRHFILRRHRLPTATRARRGKLDCKEDIRERHRCGVLGSGGDNLWLQSSLSCLSLRSSY